MVRPRRLAEPDAFARRVEVYFQIREQDGEQPTVKGLCEFLGFSDRHALSVCAGRGWEFQRVVKRARLRMEADLEARLIDPARYRPSVILQLRNNYGWRSGEAWSRRRCLRTAANSNSSEF